MPCSGYMWYEIKLKMKWTYNYFIRLAFSKDSFLIGDINNNLGVLFVAVMGVAIDEGMSKGGNVGGNH